MRFISTAALAVAPIATVCAVLAAAALAQSTITAPSNTSRSGTQSVITHSRDSLQRRMPDGQQRSRRQRSLKNPNLRPSDHKAQ